MTAAFYFSETYLRVPAVSISCVKRLFCREYAFRLLFPLLPLTQYPCFLPQWHQPKEIWLMLFFIPIRNHFINRSLSL